MTLAIDKDGKVIGQVTAGGPYYVKRDEKSSVPAYRLLTATGYRFVSQLAVRLEESR